MSKLKKKGVSINNVISYGEVVRQQLKRSTGFGNKDVTDHLSTVE